MSVVPFDPETGEVLAMTKDEAGMLTAKIKGHVSQAWLLLLEAHDRHAYTALGYSSFGAYVETEFEMSRQNAYRLLDLGRVIREIEEAAGVSRARDNGDDVPPPHLSQREAAELKDNMDDLAEEIRNRRDAGETPSEAMHNALGARRGEDVPPPPSGPRAAPEPTDEPTVGDLGLLLPGQFAKTRVCQVSQKARDAALFIDRRAIDWSKYGSVVSDLPASLRTPAAVVAREQAQQWSALADRLEQPPTLREAK